MPTLTTSGKVNIKLPGHDYRDAIQTSEQTADSIKQRFVWKDGLEIQYTLTAGKIDFKTNGTLNIDNDDSITLTWK